jgi:hypothetical protein
MPLGILSAIELTLSIIRKVGVTVEEGKRVWNELQALLPGLPDKSTDEIARIMADGWDATEALNELFKTQLATDRAALTEDGPDDGLPPPVVEN